MVKIQSISEPVKDSNGNNYKVITLEAPAFKEVVDLSTGESILALASPKTVKKCVWEQSYLDGSKHFMYDATQGQAVYGTIYTASTDEYEIDDRPVSTYTGFVEALESDANFDSAVNTMLSDAGRQLASSASDKDFNVAKEHNGGKQLSIEEEVTVEAESIEDQF
jgi:hypothetical protein|tara:strand:+ start:479 stop:973 length:495 start_codon:yes stop_codon:yes gene_type:complete